MPGQQNFLTLTQQNYFDKFEKDLLKQADLLYLNKKFGMGEEVDMDKVRHSQMLHNILCTNECELIDWVNKKITGQIEDCNTSVKLDILCGTHPNINNLTNTVEEHCEWSKVEW